MGHFIFVCARAYWASQGGVLPPQIFRFAWAVPKAVVQGCRIALETVIASVSLFLLALAWEKKFLSIKQELQVKLRVKSEN